MTTATEIELILESILDDLLPCKYCNTGAGHLGIMRCCGDEAFLCNTHLAVKRHDFSKILADQWLRCRKCHFLWVPGCEFEDVVDIRPV